MPELPEVETIARQLSKKLIGERFLEVFVNDSMVVRSHEPKEFIRRLKGKTVNAITRRGKLIAVQFASGEYLTVQVVMTGQLIFGPKMESARVVFKLSNGEHLNYNDQRRFGRLYAVDRLEDIPFLTKLGPEPLGKEFNDRWLKESLMKRKTPIKTLLMDQNFVAGIGNIYASEILFRSKINPTRPAATLKGPEIKILHRQTILVLKEAIRLQGSSINNYRNTRGEKGQFNDRIQVYGKNKEICPRCDNPIERIVMAGRSTFFCNSCQPFDAPRSGEIKRNGACSGLVLSGPN